MFKLKDTGQRSADIKAENERLKLEIERVKRQNGELRETNDRLKLSLEEAVRSTKPGPIPAPRGLRSTNVQSQASSETPDDELRNVIKQLQDRLTVAEQVTAATQKRQLVQEGVYENLPTTGGVYERVRFDPTQDHFCAAIQSTTHAGCVSVCCHQEIVTLIECCLSRSPPVVTCYLH